MNLFSVLGPFLQMRVDVSLTLLIFVITITLLLPAQSTASISYEL